MHACHDIGVLYQALQHVVLVTLYIKRYLTYFCDVGDPGRRRSSHPGIVYVCISQYTYIRFNRVNTATVSSTAHKI